MGKASSNKKVARAAKAGGGRARAAGERNLLFPVALALVVLVGTILVVYARDDRRATALASPMVGEHWHSSYGFYVCGEFQTALPEFVAPQNGGIHTHGDGLIHIHPFASSRAGENATLTAFLADAGDDLALGGGGELTEQSFSIPGGGETYTEGDDTCEGEDGEPIVQVAIWDTAAAALAGDDPDSLLTDGFGDIRFLDDGQAYTIAFMPEGAEIPAPPSTSDLEGVGADLGVPADSVPDDVDLPGATDDETGDDSTTDESTPGESTPDESTSDETDDATTTTEADGSP